jgi:protein-L-isoaspartate(D-aspartate) O-methyltransferase
MTEPRELRERLVTGLRAGGALHDDRVAAALADVPRHKFLPAIDPGRAYADDAVVTKVDADGRPISSSSQPAIMALMLEQLDVQPGHRVLEIGAGTGYNAALLAHLAGRSGEVTTLDLDDDIVAAAREHLAACGYGAVRVVQADGANGWPPGAPYDRIILTVGAWDIAPAWAGQLRPRGRLVLPLALRAGIQYSIAFEQAGDHLDSVSVLPCGFMRLRGAFAGPETIVPLGRRTGMLAESDPRPADAETLESLLAQPGRAIGTGVRVTSTDLYGGLGLWLAAREPGLGRLSAFGAAGPGQGDPAHGPAAAAARQPGMAMVATAHGCAALAPMSDPAGTAPAGLRAPVSIGACPFGTEGAELAARLAGHIRDWDASGRPSLARLRVSAYPAGAGPPAAQQVTVIDKQHTRLVLDWPDARLSPG